MILFEALLTQPHTQGMLLTLAYCFMFSAASACSTKAFLKGTEHVHSRGLGQYRKQQPDRQFTLNGLVDNAMLSSELSG